MYAYKTIQPLKFNKTNEYLRNRLLISTILSQCFAYIIIQEPNQIVVAHKPLQRASRLEDNLKRIFKLVRKKRPYYRVFVEGVSQISDDLGGSTKDDVLAVIYLQLCFMKKK